MYHNPHSRKSNFRMFILWLTFLVFVLAGIFVGTLLGAGIFGFVIIVLGLNVTNLTAIGIVVCVVFVLLGLCIGIYALCLLWMLCVRPFFTGVEVRNVVFYGPTWHPERWLFQKLYPGVPMYSEQE